MCFPVPPLDRGQPVGDVGGLKLTDIKTEVFFDLVDYLYRQKHGLTVTGNLTMCDLVEHARMLPQSSAGWTTCAEWLPSETQKRNTMRPGDRVTWLYSRKRSFVVGCGVKRIPGVIVRVSKHRIRLKVSLLGKEKIVNVDPENVMALEEG